MERRGIAEEDVASVVRKAEQTEEQRPGRCVYQSRILVSRSSTVYLLRVFVDVDRDPPEVVTAYRTSKVETDWRLYARGL
jgi:hypothetical protein